MPKHLNPEHQKKRTKIQTYFWNTVGLVEHINIPKLTDALKKEFPTADNRFIKTQISLMQTENRIKIQSHAKVWIKQPQT